MTKIILTCLALLLAGCSSIASIGAGVGAMPVSQRPTYDSPQQVIYRIDEHRYITLENYEDCRVGGIMKWHDARKDLHVVMSRYKDGGRGFWPGKFSIEPGDERFAVPSFGCGDKACYLTIAFTNDAGNTWDTFVGGQYSLYAYKEAGSRQAVIDTDVRVTKEGHIYVIPWHRHMYSRYRLDGTKDQNPKGTAIRDERCAPENTDTMSSFDRQALEEKCNDSRTKKPPFPPLPPGRYDEYDFASVPRIKTTSGQERFTCDPSLNPVINDDD
ncbi:MAG: hypothetical protein CVU34_19540 [Betaproteobacteria bacterium HGW-Betaproteobacteria-7]|jgi:hypothetical protein|nr:MAG: hypothetical protein CVU34_19540 [Betaproteobacteria bacterium HGW-Betaproteobacteria-7]